MEERRRLPPLVIDAIIAAGFFALGLVSRAGISNDAAGELYRRDPDVWNTLLIAVQSLPLILRRRYPRTVLAVVLAGFVVDRLLDYPSTLASAGTLLAFHAVGSELPLVTSRRIGWSVIPAIVAFTAVGAILYESVGIDDVVFMGVVLSVPLLLGREVYQRRRRLEELQLRAERAEREQAEAARKAVADERARIARELHDVVAHEMAVMTLQAEGARRVAAGGDARVVEALDTIRRTGHDALDQMRRMVGLLRADGVDGEEELAPQPGLAQLSSLVDQMEESGLRVEVETEGDPMPLPSGTDLHVFRIIQEALTNSLKHGGRNGLTARVRIVYDADRLEVEVVDDGWGAAADGNGSGHGLVGMSERVALLGGEFSAGPRPGGGFQVRATIPVDA